MGDGAIGGSISPLAGNDDGEQIHDNLLKYYVYFVKIKAPFFGSRRGVLRKKDKDLFYVNETKSSNM
jgi:hypothetical protein